MKKKGVSPVIATVLLLAIVIVLALIIFMWFRSFTQEAVIKFDKNIELVCEEISFSAQYDGSQLYVSNYGNVPIYDFDVQIASGGDYQTVSLREEESTFSGLLPGGVSSLALNGDKFVFIPVLMGETDTGVKESFTCDDKRYGQEVII